MLTNQQIPFFKENDFLILENAVELDLLSPVARRILAMPGRAEKPDTWPRDKTIIGRWRFMPSTLTWQASPQFNGLLTDLEGNNFLGGGDAPIHLNIHNYFR